MNKNLIKNYIIVYDTIVTRQEKIQASSAEDVVYFIIGAKEPEDLVSIPDSNTSVEHSELRKLVTFKEIIERDGETIEETIDMASLDL